MTAKQKVSRKRVTLKERKGGATPYNAPTKKADDKSDGNDGGGVKNVSTD